jgi:multiple sugar transport system ATP-binding protein
MQDRARPRRPKQEEVIVANVSIRKVHKSFGNVTIISRLSVEVEDGDFVVLVGPSGCGKSTLLRMIAGLEEISGGEIAIDGAVVNDVPAKERNIAMVFQNYALYPHMTVRQNMGFALTIMRRPASEIEQRVERAAGILGLKTLLARYPKELSGGQRQRVAMGRAMVRDPKVFLFDEPLSNLDAKLRVQMRAEIRALHQQLRTTTIYVTHDQVEAMTMADKIVVMNAGVIEQVGAPLQLYDRPANRFVAGFIGSPAMNFLDGAIAINNGAPVFRTDEGVELPIGPDFTPVPDGRVTYGVRPEHFEISGDAGMPAEVVVVEPTGAETQIVAKVGGADVVASFRERVALRPGDRIRLRPIANSAHIFNASTGQRLGGKEIV